VEEYVTNISLKYCANWDIWEAIRELSQNTLDELNTLPEISLNEEGLTIRDKGEGLTLKQLCLLGISEKKSMEARGQYGEGLKIALTIFVRKGYVVRVKSKDFVAYINKTNKFGEEVLKYEYEENKPRVDGTEITVLGFKEKTNYSERFNVNGTKQILLENSYGQMLKEDKPRLYVKNIYVQDLEKEKALYSYDLKHVRLERDRNMPNNFDIRFYIGYLISDLKDKEIIGTLLDGFRKEVLESKIAHFEPNSVWNEVFIEKYGDNATVSNDETIVSKGRYHGFKTVVIRNDTIREGLSKIGVLDTVLAIAIKQKNREEKEVKDLSRTEKTNLEKAITIVKNATELTIPDIKLYESRNSDVLGYANGKIIGLNRKILKDLGRTITVLLEEVIHMNYRIDDVTPEFQQLFSSNMSKILWYMTKEKEGTEFNAKLIRTTLRVKGHIYYQYQIKVPLSLNAKVIGKTYVPIKILVI